MRLIPFLRFLEEKKNEKLRELKEFSDFCLIIMYSSTKYRE